MGPARQARLPAHCTLLARRPLRRCSASRRRWSAEHRCHRALRPHTGRRMGRLRHLSAVRRRRLPCSRHRAGEATPAQEATATATALRRRCCCCRHPRPSWCRQRLCRPCIRRRPRRRRATSRAPPRSGTPRSGSHVFHSTFRVKNRTSCLLACYILRVRARHLRTDSATRTGIRNRRYSPGWEGITLLVSARPLPVSVRDIVTDRPAGSLEQACATRSPATRWSLWTLRR